MKPLDFSIENWESVRARVHADREAVWLAWQQHGPGTTEEVAARAGWDWRNFRPRTTELLQLGFVALVGRVRKSGVYRACTAAEAMEAFRRRQAAHVTGQLSLL
jgi:hypothetical protein